MTTPTSTVTIWESGRLVAAPSARHAPAGFARERWIATALLVLCAVVMTLYVCVLKRDVSRSETQRGALRARAVAEAECESSKPADARGACLAIFNGGDAVASARDKPAADGTPPNDIHGNGGRLATASLGAAAGAGGLGGASQ
jgi:hypothetical protein